MVLTDLSIALETIEEVSKRIDKILSPSIAEHRVQAERYIDSTIPQTFGERIDIDLRSRCLPVSVAQLVGFSEVEAFGRWSLNESSTILLSSCLGSSFRMQITLMPCGLNADQPIMIVAGCDAKVLKAEPGMKTYNLDFCAKASSKVLQFFVPNAISPMALTNGSSQDKRRLGVGIQTISIASE